MNDLPLCMSVQFAAVFGRKLSTVAGKVGILINKDK